MSKTAKTKAEERFKATERKDQQFLRERAKARQDTADQIARLKALRLAKEAADQEAAAAAAAEKAQAKAKKAAK